MVLQPVILSGGSGTRLWPLSREKYPKQLLTISGDETMLQATVSRIRHFSGSVPIAEQFIVVCNEEYRFITAEQLKEIDLPTPILMLEPFGRNTAPALTLAALASVNLDPTDSLLLVMPADHIVADVPAFHRAIQCGIQSAIDGAVVVFGTQPDRAETGYGYIQTGDTISNTNCRQLRNFFEKPDLQTATQYLKEGNFLWNSGIFLVRASVWLRAIAYFDEMIFEQCQRSFDEACIDQDFIRIDKRAFEHCPANSIDYAVMEKLATSELGISCHVVPIHAGWSDVGAWDAVWQTLPKDSRGNAIRGEVILEDSDNCLIVSENRLVTGLGLQNIIVIETTDAVLVLNSNCTQNLKRIIQELKKKNCPQTEHHRKIYRPWGHYDAIDEGMHFKVKHIVVKPGGRLSMQSHKHRAEHWIVVSGTALVTRGNESIYLSANQSTYIPLGVMHRLENPSVVDLNLIEVQSGLYLEEDDIIRYDDAYGRT